jgi:hypothetical protein
MTIFQRLKSKIVSEFYDHIEDHHPDLIAYFLADQNDKDVVNELAFHEKPIVRIAVSKSEKLTEEALMHLITDISPSVVAHAVTNKATTPKLKAYILENKIKLNDFLSKNPTLTEEECDQAWKEHPTSIQSILANPVTTSNFLRKTASHNSLYHHIFLHPNCDASVLHAMFDNMISPDRDRFFKDFLKHKNTDKSLLTKFLQENFPRDLAKTRGTILLEMKERKFITKNEMLAIAKNIKVMDGIR